MLKKKTLLIIIIIVEANLTIFCIIYNTYIILSNLGSNTYFASSYAKDASEKKKPKDN